MTSEERKANYLFYELSGVETLEKLWKSQGEKMLHKSSREEAIKDADALKRVLNIIQKKFSTESLEALDDIRKEQAERESL